MAQQPSKPDSYQQQYEDITSATRIAAILRPLQQHRSIISIALPAAKRLYSSTLLDVNVEQGFLLLDELNPSDGHVRINIDSRIGLSARREGIDIKMILDVSDIGSEDGMAFYKTPFPKVIRYRQRRHAFRVSVSAVQSIPVEFTDSKGTVFSGELQDISAEGMCVRFPPRSAAPQEKNEAPLDYIILLPDKKRIQGQFILRRTALHEPSRSVQIGGRFEQSGKAQARAIERFALELQRESRRKLSR